MANPGILPIRQTKNIIVQNIVSTEKTKMKKQKKVEVFDQLETFDEKLNFIRNKRDKLIKETIWIKEKYECQLKEKQTGLSSGCEMTQFQFEKWIEYWKKLRNIPNQILNKEIDINNVKFPVQPK